MARRSTASGYAVLKMLALVASWCVLGVGLYVAHSAVQEAAAASIAAVLAITARVFQAEEHAMRR